MSGKPGASLTQAITLFNEHQYFECHEVLEDLWRPLPPGTEKTFLQGLIQIAVGLHHLQRNNFIGARNKLQSGLEKLDAVQREATMPPTADAAAFPSNHFQSIVALPTLISANRTALNEVLRLGPEALPRFPQGLLPVIQTR